MEHGAPRQPERCCGYGETSRGACAEQSRWRRRNTARRRRAVGLGGGVRVGDKLCRGNEHDKARHSRAETLTALATDDGHAGPRYDGRAAGALSFGYSRIATR
jgi:hypothetical protein